VWIFPWELCLISEETKGCNCNCMRRSKGCCSQTPKEDEHRVALPQVTSAAASIVLHPDNCTEEKCHNRHMPAVPSNPANYCFPTWKYGIYPFPGEITYSAARQWKAHFMH
ncbi:hypothetical protein HGM15179_005980, partial [Zosterops borbonicus]